MAPALIPLLHGEADQVEAAAGGYVMSGATAAGGDIVLVAEPESTMQPRCTHVVCLGVLGGALIVMAAAVGAVAAGTGLLRSPGSPERLNVLLLPAISRPSRSPGPTSWRSWPSASTRCSEHSTCFSRRRQSQLVVDAGAELQAPLTALRTNIELLISAQASAGKSLDAETEAALRSDVVDQLDELTSRIHRLVEEARDAPAQTSS